MRLAFTAAVCLLLASCNKSAETKLEKIASYAGEPVPLLNQSTEPFTAKTGKLKVVWTVEGKDAAITINVEGRDGTAESVCVFASKGGENRVNVKPGEYFLKVVGGNVKWTAVVYEDR